MLDLSLHKVEFHPGPGPDKLPKDSLGDIGSGRHNIYEYII